jgi:mono/diheme cytochrome c family protein
MFFIAFLAACTGGSKDTAVAGDVAAGEVLYTDTCSSCHGADGKGATTTSPTAADLTFEVNDLSDAELAETMLSGKGDMPGYSSILSDEDVADITAYLHSAFGG